ncbi:MAG: iron-sulfur cluster assembly protein [Pseudomonadota bacterium]
MMKPVANEDMVRNALGDDYDDLAEPPSLQADREHPLFGAIRKALMDVFDPEIPVNVYELGLIYKIEMTDMPSGQADVAVLMTLTSPACPVAQEMPIMVQSAILPLDGVGDVAVDIVWDPTWDPSKMSETAKLQLNMFT